LHLLPEKYDQLELSSNEKSFAKVLERALKGSELACFVLKINPRKAGLKDDYSLPELFHLLVVEDGIVLFKFFETEDASQAANIIKAWNEYGLLTTLSRDIEAILKHSRYLTDDIGNIKYAFTIKLLFSKIKKFDVMGKIDNEFLLSACLLEEDVQQVKTIGASVLSALLEKKKKIADEDVINSIFQRLCPEITIPRKFFLDEYQKVSGIDGQVTNEDRSVRSYRLDESQINYINRIAKGNQLILACAGSGKSVLLISKCFKLASLNPAESFLIICFNTNLRDYYLWTASQAGFLSGGKVKVNSFYQFCRQLLISNGIPLPSKQETFEDECKLWFSMANNALSKGLIRDRFYGIFIDEIQIFKPEWYRFCFNLLKNQSEDCHYFVIAGDKSQDIKSNIKHGKAPWQGHGEKYPKYSNRTFAIEINYRNSKPINDAIDRFVEVAKKKGLSLGADMTTDPELFLRGIAYRDGDAPVIIENRDVRQEGEASKIIAEIKYLIEVKEYLETDIAIIFYNKNSKLIEQLQSDFNREGWNDPAILFTADDKGTFGMRRGITLATIEGALGLDYRAVVLAGLHSLGKFAKGWREQAKVESDFFSISNDEKEKRAKAFSQNVNYIYTGCTRAKDSLSIVLSMESGQCIYSDLLRSSIGGRR